MEKKLKPAVSVNQGDVQKEVAWTRKALNLEELLEFQIAHKIKIEQNELGHYHTWVDGIELGGAFTPIGSLVTAVIQYKQTFGNND